MVKTMSSQKMMTTTHSAATTEQVDEEIEVESHTSPHMVSSPPPTVTEERAGDEVTEEDVDIDGSTTPVIHDEFWDAAHPNSPITTPLTQIPQSPAVTEEVHTGSDERQPTLQTIAEEIPAASAEEIEQPVLTVATSQQSPQQEDSVPSTGTDTVPFATAEEIAKSDAITDKNDSTGSPRPIFDVRPKRINLQPVPSMPQVGRSIRRPQFDNAAFFAEKNFFIGESPYDSPKIRRQRFWTKTQMNFYSSLLFDKNKVFPHRHIPHVDMESIPCFNPVLAVLHDAGLLGLCTDICDWNEELILQFYATLHLSGEVEDIHSWALDWMSENTHYKAPADELLRALPVDPPQEGAKRIYEEPELPNHLMQVLMNPLTEGEAPRTTFLVKDLLYVPRTVYRILSKTLSPIKGHNSDTEEVVGSHEESAIQHHPWYSHKHTGFLHEDFGYSCSITV